MRYMEVRVNSKYVKQTRRVNYLIEWGILESDNMGGYWLTEATTKAYNVVIPMNTFMEQKYK